MYAIIKTGGKQYRVQEGESLLVERLPAEDGATVALEPLLFVDGSDVVDGEDLAKVTIEARVVAHERGPKLRIVKFKPKRGYKRRTGHRQELTRIEVTELAMGAGSQAKAAKDTEAPAKASTAPGAAKPAGEKAAPTKASAAKPTASKPASAKAGATKAAGAKPADDKGAGAAKPAAAKKAPAKTKKAVSKETDDGS
jgi:large subunit ribosomal protein L21